MPIAGRSTGGIRPVLLFALLAGLTVGCAGSLDQRFDAADRRSIVAATQETLENNETGESKNWINPATDRHGTVMITRIFKRSGVPCREFQQTATIEGRTIIAYDVACRRDDGTWKSEEYTSLDGAIIDAPLYQDRRHYDPRYYRHYRRSQFHFGYGYNYDRHGHYWPDR